MSSGKLLRFKGRVAKQDQRSHRMVPGSRDPARKTDVSPSYYWLHGRTGKVFLGPGGFWGVMVGLGVKNGWNPRRGWRKAVEPPVRLSAEDALSLGRIQRRLLTQAGPKSQMCPARSQMADLIEQTIAQLLAGRVVVRKGPRPTDEDLPPRDGRPAHLRPVTTGQVPREMTQEKN